MRKLLCMLTVLLLLAFSVNSCLAYAAEDVDENTGFGAVIEDNANLLDPGEIPELLETMKQVTPFCPVGVLTRPASGGDSYGGTVENIAYQWGRSVFGERDFIVFLIDMKSRNICIYSNGGMVRRFTEADADTVTDNVSSYATHGRYGDCTEAAMDQIAKVLGGEQIARPMKYISNVLIAVCLSVILCFVIVSRTLKTRNAAEAVRITAMVATGAGTSILARKLVRTVTSSSSSGGGHGGGHGGGGGGHSGGGGHHGF